MAIYYKEGIIVNEVRFKVSGSNDPTWIEILMENNNSLLCGTAVSKAAEAEIKRHLRRPGDSSGSNVNRRHVLHSSP